MGACGSKSPDPANPNTGSVTSTPPQSNTKPVSKTENIEQTLAAKADHDAKVVKLLLLGPGESGKSTLFKQIQSIYGEGFNQNQLRDAIGGVHNNTMLCLKALADNCVEYGDIAEENEDVVDYLQRLKQVEVDSAVLDPKWIPHYKKMWADPVIQETWKNRSDYQIYGCAQYLIERIDDIMKPDYVPSLEDILQIRVRTTGIVESLFTVEDVVMKLVDVGGQRAERRKWLYCFSDVTAIIFLAAISEYDQKLFEDHGVNRLEEALVLFQEVCHSHYFHNTPILLFLNKRDLFEDKIMRVPLANFRPDYPGPEKDAIAASDWIAEQFRSCNTENRNKIVYCIVTTAVERNIVRDLFVTVKDIVIRETLQGTGLA